MIKRILIYLQSAILMMAAFASCGGGGDDPIEPEGNEVLIDTTVVISAAGGTSRVQLISHSSWKAEVTSGAEWCSIKPNSGGSGGATIAINIKENSDLATRTAKISFKAKTGTGSVTVVQQQIDVLDLTVDDSCDFGPEGGSFAAKLDYNVEYNISCGADWVKQTGTKALQHATASFAVDKNNTGEDRSCEVTFSGAGITHTVTVTQEKAYFGLSAGDVHLNAADKQLQIVAESNVSYTVTMPDAAWISLSGDPAAGEDGSETSTAFDFALEENEEFFIRECKIAFGNGDYNIADTIYVLQKAVDVLSYEFLPFEFGPEGGSFEFDIDPDANYSIALPEGGWVQLSTVDSLPNRRIITVPQNFSAEDRTGSITISYGDNSNSIEIAQSAAGIKISADQLSFATAGGTDTLAVNSNVAFRIIPPENVSWCRLDSLEDGSCAVIVSANETESDRECSFEFVCDEYDVHSFVNVKQAQKDAFTVSPLSFSFGPECGEFELAIHSNIDFDCEMGDATSWISEIEASRTTSRRVYKVALNNTGLPREGFLQFEGNGISHTVSVTQANAYILALTESFEYEDAAGEGSFTVENNVDYQVKTLGGDWFSAGFTENNTVSFSLEENNDWGSRTGKVVLYNDQYAAYDTVTVVQGAKFYLDIEQTEFSLTPQGGNVEVKAKSNKEYQYHIAEGIDWIVETSPLTFEVAANNSGQAREGEIIFEQQGFQKSVSISQDAAYIVLSDSELEFPEEGGSLQFSVQSNIGFAVLQPDAEWASCSQSSPMSYTIDVAANPVPEVRECSVTVQGSGFDTAASLHIVQAEKGVFEIAETEFSLGPSAAEITLEINTNMEYDFSIGASWISDAGNNKFTIDKHTGEEMRQGEIEFTAKDQIYVVTVSQEAPYMTLSAEQLDFKVEGGKQTVSAEANVPITVKIADDCDWLTYTENDGVYEFEASINEGDAPRTGSVRFLSEDFDYEFDLPVSQDQANMFVVITPEVTIGPEATEIVADIKTNMEYTYSVSQDWIEDAGDLKFNISKNEGEEERVGTIDFVADTLTYSITVTQQIPALSISEKEFTLDSLGGQVSVQVNANLGYSVSVPETDWLSMSESAEENKYTFEISENTDVPTRSAQVVFKANEFSTADTLTIYQTGIIDRYPFYLDDDYYVSGPVAGEVIVTHTECDDVEVVIKSATWLEELPDKSTPTQKVFALSSNMSGSARNAVVELTGMTKTLPLTIHQDIAILEMSFFDKNISADGETMSAEVNANFPISISVEDEWVTAEINEDQTAVTYTVEANTTGESRQTTISITNEDINYTRSYTFTQALNYYFTLDPEQVETSSAGGEYSITVSTNIDEEYTVLSLNSWISCTATEDPNVWLVTVSENASASGRSGSIYFRGNSFQVTLPVIQEGYRNPDYYYSEDFSEDGTIIQLQSATVGNGIPMVLMGDAFSDRLIADGTYMSCINKAIDAFFAIEPYKSFRKMFNIYCIKTVSLNEIYADDASTALSTYFSGGSRVGGDNKLIRSRASIVENPITMRNAVIIVLMNSTRYGGTTYLQTYSSLGGDYGIGEGIAYIPLCSSDEEFTRVLQHEAGGHGFGKLEDEYFYEANGAIPEDVVQQYLSDQALGFYKNVDFTADSAEVRWSKFIDDEDYQYDGVGVFEGACTYVTGAYRPTENSLMRYNTGGFNAPSREAIYYRLHKIAYGSSWSYDFDAFKEYDAINRKSSPGASQNRFKGSSKASGTLAPLPSPVIIRE